MEKKVLPKKGADHDGESGVDPLQNFKGRFFRGKKEARVIVGKGQPVQKKTKKKGILMKKKPGTEQNKLNLTLKAETRGSRMKKEIPYQRERKNKERAAKGV